MLAFGLAFPYIKKYICRTEICHCQSVTHSSGSTVAGTSRTYIMGVEYILIVTGTLLIHFHLKPVSNQN